MEKKAQENCSCNTYAMVNKKLVCVECGMSYEEAKKRRQDKPQ